MVNKTKNALARTSRYEGEAVTFSKWCGRFFLVATATAVSMPAQAVDAWRIKPDVEVRATYSDNLDLSSTNEDGGFVTSVNPGVSVRKQGGRMQVAADYQLENLMYWSDSDRNDTNHRLNASATIEAIEPSIFVDLDAAISQEIISSTGAVSNNNITGAANRGDAISFGVSPYWRPYMQGYATGEFRLNYSQRESDGGASDSKETGYKIDLRSGNRFKKVTWDLSVEERDEDRDSADDVKFSNSEVGLAFQVSDSFAVFGTVGHADNDFVSSRADDNNGSYSNLGLIYTPSRQLSMRAGFGNNSIYSVTWTPTTRTSLDLSYADNDVGLNAGDVWNAALSHRTRNTTWTASYSETTTTYLTQIQEARNFNGVLLANVNSVEEALLAGSNFAAACGGNFTNLTQFSDGQGGTLFAADFADCLALGVTDEVFESINASVGVEKRTGKSTFRVNLFQQDRTFLVSLNDEQVTGASASWEWRFGGRTRSTVSGTVRNLENSALDRDDDLFTFSAQVRRDLSPTTHATVELTRTERDSSDPGADYEENQIGAFLVKVFD